MGKIFLFCTVLFLTGCAAKSSDFWRDKYESSLAHCTENGNELDCDWQGVTSKWDTATPADFSDRQNTKTE